ncbi:O-fucosyltransferase family protein [Zea mays]|uniref:O-fucosyltransferase family protein n=2 Tax=Zea mays TaxID=4577 RepID=A0A1D6N7H2_MAIZE|nr:O-fucosyltransferase family protein [Zea mays]ONM36537.1 O-fucosyltransferase family protein [Zea mays]
MQNHAYSRLGISGTGAVVPSPPSSPRRAWGRRASAKGGWSARASADAGWGGGAVRRVARAVLAALLRRQAVFLFAPLLYVAAMLLYMGSISLDSVPRIIPRPAPGSMYRSPQLYARLRADMDADNATDALAAVWRHAYRGGVWRPCISNNTNGLPESNGYIYIEANGGLNQQRTSICNAVAVAGFLNATLVIPNFHYHSIWRDPSDIPNDRVLQLVTRFFAYYSANEATYIIFLYSKFSDIYDEDYFIERLKNDVRVIDKVPEFIMERFGHNLSNAFNFKIKAWSPIQFYEDIVLPKLIEERLIRISPFANRLSFDAPPAVQRLRCLANFEALKFSKPITTISNTLISRMREKSAENNGKYVAVHLRFEEDMVAFSCCVFDGGDNEKKELDAAREKGWRGKFTRPGRVIRPGAIRMNGKCPLTPLEVGLMLRGMGFNNNTAIYLASGRIYKAEKNMSPLLEMFPLLQTKETLALDEELAPFKVV